MAIARLLDRSGHKLILTGRNSQVLQSLSDTLSGTHQYIESDLQHEGSIDSLWQQIDGSLDGMVHAAGTLKHTLAELAKPSDRVDCYRLRTGLKLRRWRNGASIVWISSLSVRNPAIGFLHYTTAKAALEAAARQWALELAGRQIRVNTVAPGLIETPMSERVLAHCSAEEKKQIYAQSPLGAGTVDDVAHAVAFLLSTESRWITGTTLACDGGASLKSR
jgi:NAD(P)-dependent dehydrogenase (short-subunit alcohol dehydrogenase family)